MQQQIGDVIARRVFSPQPPFQPERGVCHRPVVLRFRGTRKAIQTGRGFYQRIVRQQQPVIEDELAVQRRVIDEEHGGSDHAAPAIAQETFAGAEETGWDIGADFLPGCGATFLRKPFPLRHNQSPRFRLTAPSATVAISRGNPRHTGRRLHTYHKHNRGDGRANQFSL